MEALNIYNYSNHSDYLSAVTQRYLPRGKRATTATEWAKRLGYRSPQSLTMVLTGQRLPGQDMLMKIATDLNLTIQERRYLELLVSLERAKSSGESIKHIVEELEILNPNFSRQQTLTSVTFSYIAEWYHLVIEQLVGTKGFQETGAWLREKLRRKVTLNEASAAISTLLRLGLISRDEATGQLRRAAHGIKTTNGIPDTAIRLHHRQMTQRALEAIEEQSTLDERESTSLTLRFDKAKIGDAKEFLQTMKDLFNERFYQEASGDVFQLNIQLFNHTQSQ